MGDSISRILVQTTVRKAIRDIRESPERSIRNLVDMALNFSDGRFQKEFFYTSQQMLENENSAYYSLIRNMVEHTDEEKLLTFGMNLGYNCSILGARQIRQIEAAEGYNIPWSISLEMGPDSFSQNQDRYHALIEEGEHLGIFIWFLFSHDQAHDCLSLAAAHPNEAFVLFCSAEEITWTLIDCASELNNLMLAVPMNEDAPVICSLLREAGLLYSLYTTYGAADLPKIESGDWFYDMEQMHPVFSVFIPKRECSKEIQQRAYSVIHEARMAQTHATMLWEMYQDNLLIDRIVSEDGCWAGFCADGRLHSINGHGEEKTYGSTDVPLETLFRQAFPK